MKGETIPPQVLDRISTFGEMLRFSRRRAGLTQTELSIAVGYSDAQISRLEQNLRLPDIANVQARFLSALKFQHEPQRPQGIAKAMEYFERAIAKDSSSTLARAGLADCYVTRGSRENGTLPSLQAMAKAKSAATEALELNGRLAEAPQARR